MVLRMGVSLCWDAESSSSAPPDSLSMSCGGTALVVASGAVSSGGSVCTRGSLMGSEGAGDWSRERDLPCPGLVAGVTVSTVPEPRDRVGPGDP